MSPMTNAEPVAQGTSARTGPRRVALLGNPNVGKSTLFNMLCGLRVKTANFPGSTVEHHVGSFRDASGRDCELIDLPGVYSLRLELPESKVCRDCLEGRIGDCTPDAALIVLDSTNLSRNLQFAASALRRGVPSVVALNMSDEAARRGLSVDARAASDALGCPVVAISGRSGAGVPALVDALSKVLSNPRPPSPANPLPAGEPGTADSVRWANQVFAQIGGSGTTSREALHDRLDAAFTHPVLGIALFATLMAALFAALFWVAKWPMEWIGSIFGTLASLVTSALPDGVLQDLLANGIVGGIAATVVFLPQICILFFLLSLLEDSGYLARAAFALDRTMRRFGLPGQAFMPLLSSHACALPGILSTRLIPDSRDRIAAILAAPFMSCSARLPVYVLLCGILFADRPMMAGLAFVACYVLGAAAGLLTALLARRTVLRGASRPMVLELPQYRIPHLRTALATALDRGMLFLRNAGSVILAIAVVMWWLSAYPRVDGESPGPADAAATLATGDRDAAPTEAEIERAQQQGSFAGMAGRALEPLFRPIGLDSQLTLAVLTSFMAREVFTTTVYVVTGAGSDADPDEGTLERVRSATRLDGTPLFTVPTAWSLLVFYVLAMQCLPTLALVRKETGSWRWPLAQFAWMTGLAYIGALVAFRLAGGAA
jgi:ferrous iron transport protein B